MLVAGGMRQARGRAQPLQTGVIVVPAARPSCAPPTDLEAPAPGPEYGTEGDGKASAGLCRRFLKSHTLRAAPISDAVRSLTTPISRQEVAPTVAIVRSNLGAISRAMMSSCAES
jgi:hypothetical protein